MINFNELFGVKRGGDKIAHMLVGLVIGIISVFFLQGSIYVLLPVAVAAVGKEIYDEISYGGFDFFDMFATLVGGWIGIMLTGLVLNLIG